jgi:hypothetical protein
MKLKMIVAALAFAATGSANALIVDGSGGNGELFMTLWDEAGQQSYTLDLNITMDDFLASAAANQAFSYAADANMTSFLGSVGNVSELKYAIGAMDTVGATSTDFHRYITTASTIDLGNTVTNTLLKNLGSSGAFFLGDTNGMIGAADSLIVTDSSLVAYAGSAQWGNNWGTDFNGISTGLIGEDLGMYFLSQTSGAFAVRNSPSVYAELDAGNGFQYYANLSENGNLTLAAPVPEADTYALMLAGLGLVGYMVRRRRDAA